MNNPLKNLFRNNNTKEKEAMDRLLRCAEGRAQFMASLSCMFPKNKKTLFDLSIDINQRMAIDMWEKSMLKGQLNEIENILKSRKQLKTKVDLIKDIINPPPKKEEYYE